MTITARLRIALDALCVKGAIARSEDVEDLINSPVMSEGGSTATPRPPIDVLDVDNPRIFGFEFSRLESTIPAGTPIAGVNQNRHLLRSTTSTI